MTKWEYAIETIDRRFFAADLNKRGADGWELCHILDGDPVMDYPRLECVFKRPKPPKVEDGK